MSSRSRRTADRWSPYLGPDGTTPVPGLWVLRGLYSPLLENRRDLVVYRPESLDRSQPTTILYGQDGQNLFDDSKSYAGSWRAVEAVDALESRGKQVVLVGIANTGKGRFSEYTPLLPTRTDTAVADRYLEFLIGRVVPVVESGLEITTGPDLRGVFGASLGGLFSLYAFFAEPSLFGLCGAFSPSLQVGADRFFPWIEQASRPEGVRGRIYLDVGTREVSRPRRHFNSRHYGANVTAMRGLLRKKGYRMGSTLQFVRAKRAIHHESAWARRLPGALDFLVASPSRLGRIPTP